MAKTKIQLGSPVEWTQNNSSMIPDFYYGILKSKENGIIEITDVVTPNLNVMKSMVCNDGKIKRISFATYQQQITNALTTIEMDLEDIKNRKQVIIKKQRALKKLQA